jgi:hypothetical protein
MEYTVKRKSSKTEQEDLIKNPSLDIDALYSRLAQAEREISRLKDINCIPQKAASKPSRLNIIKYVLSLATFIMSIIALVYSVNALKEQEIRNRQYVAVSINPDGNVTKQYWKMHASNTHLNYGRIKTWKIIENISRSFEVEVPSIVTCVHNGHVFSGNSFVFLSFAINDEIIGSHSGEIYAGTYENLYFPWFTGPASSFVSASFTQITLVDPGTYVISLQAIIWSEAMLGHVEVRCTIDPFL